MKYTNLNQIERECISKSVNNLINLYEIKNENFKMINVLKKASFYGHRQSTEFLGLFYYDLENYFEAKIYFKRCINLLTGKIKVYYSNLLRNCLINIEKKKN